MVIEHIEISGQNLGSHSVVAASTDEVSNSLTSAALIEQLTASLHEELVRIQAVPRVPEPVAA